MSPAKSMPLLLVGLLAITPVAYAQVPTRPDPVVTVKLAPSLEAKAKKLGDREVAEMAQELTKEVRQALAGSHSPGAPVRADLVLVDLQPNRPTFTQLGNHPGLSLRSIALGGAAITGTLAFPDGHTESLTSSYYGDNLRDDPWPGEWRDAEMAFYDLADSLSHGKTPHDRPVSVATRDSFGSWPY